VTRIILHIVFETLFKTVALPRHPFLLHQQATSTVSRFTVARFSLTNTNIKMFAKTAVLAGFAAVAAAKPLAYPQQLDLAALIAQSPPASAVIASTPGVITVDPTKLASAAFASITASPLPQTLVTSGAAALDKRAPKTAETVSTSTSSADACATRPALPSGAGPMATPDTASGFLAFGAFSSSASAAPTPSGYTNAFTNLQAENSAYG